jgi:acetolactate synthase-1/2/3 large subunit
MNGADRLCEVLQAGGTDTVFGLPGSQNIALFEALRTSSLRTIVATNELAASFMANGYARASGRPGVLTTIPGPGFAYALAGLAEAHLDSVPLICIVENAIVVPGRRFQLQALNQRAAASPFVKGIFDVDAVDGIDPTLRSAKDLCLAGEPGPVVVQVPSTILSTVASGLTRPGSLLTSERLRSGYVREIQRRLTAAKRPLFYVGQGALGAAAELEDLVEALGIPVITTTSARGVISEEHEWVLRSDRGNVEVLNEFIANADLILALGCKFSHNGARGFRLRLPPDRFVHVDASPDVLGANYPASLMVEADVPTLIRLLREQALQRASARSAWAREEIDVWRKRVLQPTDATEPRIRGVSPSTAEGFFAALREAMPPEAVLVLDSGLHQMLARRYFRVLRPRTFVLPTDLQAMGYALPAAIGAKIAKPDSPVVALLGDGGFAASGLELLTAARENVAITAVVFNDGHYGLIRREQFGVTGHSFGTDLRNPDLSGIAKALGIRHLRLGDDCVRTLSSAVRASGVTLVEVGVGERVGERARRAWISLASSLHALVTKPGRGV